VVSSTRAAAIQAVSLHYTSLFSDDPALSELRKSYAIPANAVKTPERRQLMNSFFFWTAWACGAERPEQHITYTQNWPHEPLIDNQAHEFNHSLVGHQLRNRLAGWYRRPGLVFRRAATC
jgi:nitric oxide reductase subunit B